MDDAKAFLKREIIVICYFLDLLTGIYVRGDQDQAWPMWSRPYHIEDQSKYSVHDISNWILWLSSKRVLPLSLFEDEYLCQHKNFITFNLFFIQTSSVDKQWKKEQKKGQTRMGVNNLSKLIRDSNDTPDLFASSPLLSGRNIGIDLSVICH